MCTALIAQSRAAAANGRRAHAAHYLASAVHLARAAEIETAIVEVAAEVEQQADALAAEPEPQSEVETAARAATGALLRSVAALAVTGGHRSGIFRV